MTPPVQTNVVGYVLLRLVRGSIGGFKLSSIRPDSRLPRGTYYMDFRPFHPTQSNVYPARSDCNLVPFFTHLVRITRREQGDLFNG